MATGPSKTVKMYHGEALFWQTHGRVILHALYNHLPVGQERSARAIEVPDHPQPTTTSSHTSIISMNFYDQTTFQQSSLGLDHHDLPGGNITLSSLSSPDSHMNDAIILDDKDPLANLDPILISRNKPHAYVLAVYFDTVNAFFEVRGVTPLRKWVQRARSFAASLSFCKGNGWPASVDRLFFGTMESELVPLAKAAYARCMHLHLARLNSGTVRLSDNDNVLPSFTVQDCAAIHFLIGCSIQTTRTSAQLATRQAVASYVVSRLAPLVKQRDPAANIDIGFSATFQDIILTTTLALDDFEIFAQRGETGMGHAELGAQLQIMFVGVFIIKEGSLVRRINEYNMVWPLEHGEADPFKNHKGRRNLWFFFMALVKLAFIEIRTKAGRKPSGEHATLHFLEAPTILIDNDTLLDLCANEGIRAWYKRYIQAYENNTDDSERIRLHSFYDGLVVAETKNTLVKEA